MDQGGRDDDLMTPKFRRATTPAQMYELHAQRGYCECRLCVAYRTSHDLYTRRDLYVHTMSTIPLSQLLEGADDD